MSTYIVNKGLSPLYNIEKEACFILFIFCTFLVDVYFLSKRICYNTKGESMPLQPPLILNLYTLYISCLRFCLMNKLFRLWGEVPGTKQWQRQRKEKNLPEAIRGQSNTFDLFSHFPEWKFRLLVCLWLQWKDRIFLVP